MPLMQQPSFFERLLMKYARNFPIRRGKLRAINALWKIAIGDRGTARQAALKYGGMVVPCELNHMLQRQLYFFGTYFVEEGVLDCWINEAKRATVILDVGANAGIYSLAALAAQPGVVVHAFEPTPEIAKRLREAKILNRLDRLSVHEMAVSSADGDAVLMRYGGESGLNDGMNFICLVDCHKSPSNLLVKAVCLDQFCQNHAIDFIDLLKIDIQGHEYAALKGAENLVNAGRIGVIFTELNWNADGNAECSATESIRLLEHAGYSFARPDKKLHWRKAGTWLRELNEVVARRDIKSN